MKDEVISKRDVCYQEIKNYSKRALSSFYDGSLDESLSLGFCEEFKAYSSLKSTWYCYCLISDVLKKDLPRNISFDLQKRVRAEIDSLEIIEKDLKKGSDEGLPFQKRAG